MAKIAIKGLRTETAIHMFFSVFGKTPLSCSSTKLQNFQTQKFLASKALNPKIKALRIPPDCNGVFQFWIRISKPLLAIK